MKTMIAVLFLTLNTLGFAATVNYQLEPSSSKFLWRATKVGGQHNGAVGLSKGTLIETNGKLTGGKIVIDLNALTVEDIKSPEKNKDLVDHLKSDDFFSTQKHSQAILTIKSVTEKKGGNYEISADLAIKDIVKPVTFPATIIKSGKKYTANADLKIDRTNYDIKYRSGKFFPSLGDKLIHDDFFLKASFDAVAETKK